MFLPRVLLTWDFVVLVSLFDVTWRGQKLHICAGFAFVKQVLIDVLVVTVAKRFGFCAFAWI